MNSDNLVSLFTVAVVMLFVLNLYIRRVKRIFVADYQRGVRFVKGTFSSVLGPGSYKLFTRNEQIEVVDMRPQPIILERIAFRDVWHNESFLSIGAELLVCDPHLSITKLKNQVNDSFNITRDTLRLVASRGVTDRSSESRGKMAAEITQTINAELTPLGMKISNVEIIELWSRPSPGHGTAVAH
jgi:regulator of protease activity HflC (stomatin/prohibitin superfamily)